MTDQVSIEATEARPPRHEDRRSFFRAFGTAAAVAGGVALVSRAAPALAQSSVSDADILNFALNLEYLEGNFYSYVLTGQPLPSSDMTGTGTQGTVTGGRKVTFTDPAVASLAAEIGFNERSHVEFLRTQLGSSAIAQPQIDLSVSPTSAFSMAARAAGLIGQNQSFDPYASDENFLMASFLFEEVGVSAYKGSAALISNKTYLEAAAGILAVEAYQASSVRTMLYRKGLQMPSIIQMVNAISNARDSVDGSTDDDQGLTNSDGSPNIVPTDSNGLIYGRTAQATLNVAYLTNASVNKGGFFPAGVNGNIVTSAAN